MSNINKIRLILEYIDSFQYNNALKMLDELEPTNEVKSILMDADHKPTMKFLLKKIPKNKANGIIKKFHLDGIYEYSEKEKYDMYLKKTYQPVTFRIVRNMLLNDSICYFLDNNMKNKAIEIQYVDELASDEGGLSRDWFTNVSKELINTGIFVPVPNGDKLTFNRDKEDMMLYNFVGQFIAAAFNNKKTTNIKLSSFIWKRMLGEEITIEDMKDYDKDYYESLKWILDNDPSLLEMTFVDSNDVELCKYGGDILVTNENKEEYIKLIIENKIINENIEYLDSIANGFRSVVDFDIISLFDTQKIQEIVYGVETIDVNDWMQNTVYNRECKKEFDNFFRIISKWSNEKLQKLLVFATGSSNVPFGGFKNFVNYGGTFTLHFNKNDLNALPTSHTCFNKIEIPCYPSYQIFEQKLTLAIECDEFGFS